MKLSEKLKQVRKHKGYSQEELAERCHVSRQTISKWELDITIPDVEKLLILSDCLGLTLDVLVRDDLELDGTIRNTTCNKALLTNEQGGYEGVLIKESIDNEDILDAIKINKVELWKTKGKPKYWTALTFSSTSHDLPERLSKVMINDESKGGNWFVDFKKNNTKFIVFRDLVLSYTIGNAHEKEQVVQECMKRGISDTEILWSE